MLKLRASKCVNNTRIYLNWVAYDLCIILNKRLIAHKNTKPPKLNLIT